MIKGRKAETDKSSRGPGPSDASHTHLLQEDRHEELNALPAELTDGLDITDDAQEVLTALVQLLLPYCRPEVAEGLLFGFLGIPDGYQSAQQDDGGV